MSASHLAKSTDSTWAAHCTGGGQLCGNWGLCDGFPSPAYKPRGTVAFSLASLAQNLEQIRHSVPLCFKE